MARFFDTTKLYYRTVAVCPYLFSEYTFNIGQHFLDMQYIVYLNALYLTVSLLSLLI